MKLSKKKIKELALEVWGCNLVKTDKRNVDNWNEYLYDVVDAKTGEVVIKNRSWDLLEHDVQFTERYQLESYQKESENNI